MEEKYSGAKVLESKGSRGVGDAKGSVIRAIDDRDLSHDWAARVIDIDGKLE